MTGSAVAILQAAISDQEKRLKDVEEATREAREAGRRATMMWEAERAKLLELREGLEAVQTAQRGREVAE